MSCKTGSRKSNGPAHVVKCRLPGEIRNALPFVSGGSAGHELTSSGPRRSSCTFLYIALAVCFSPNKTHYYTESMFSLSIFTVGGRWRIPVFLSAFVRGRNTVDKCLVSAALRASLPVKKHVVPAVDDIHRNLMEGL